MTKKKTTTVFLGLGSNLGDRVENLKEAIRLLAENNTIIKISSLYETDPVGYEEQPDFINAVCEIATSFSPEELLTSIKQIEHDMGRTTGILNGPRIIDIDILMYHNEIINTDRMTIPHPRMAERFFVLIPFAEIAPDVVHPVHQRTIRELLNRLGSIVGVTRLQDKINLKKD